MADRKVIVSVDDLTGGYGQDAVVLDRISFNIYEGEIFVILGRSGCGKSTLLKHLIGLIKPVFGKIIIDGDDIYHCDESTFRKFLIKMGVLYQSSALFSLMTVGENIALPLTEYTDLPKESIDAMVKMKLSLVNLNGCEHLLPSQLSGGMRKRAALARAMALSPQILFFDEPSAGLDPIVSRELDDLIVNLNKSLGTTMVIVTHELESVFAVAQRIIFLDKESKGIVAEGDPHYLKDNSENQLVRRFLNRLS